MPRRCLFSRSCFTLIALACGCARVPDAASPSVPAALSTPASSVGAVGPEKAPSHDGLILVAKVAGSAHLVRGGTTTTLKVDDVVGGQSRILTGVDSRVVLVFANGATAELGADSELIVDEFKQDPFGATIRVSELEEEPSPSRTLLALNRGELVGNVKGLKFSHGSSFIVQSPVGTVGVRGAPATFRLVFRPSGTGQAFFSLSTAKGNLAFFQGPKGGPNATALSVPAGQEIVFTVSVTQNAQGGLVEKTSGP